MPVMKRFIIKILVTAALVMILSNILPGVHIDNFWTAIVVALVLSLLDTFIKPLLILFTLPATIFTFGLFLFVINAVVILIDSHFVHGFKVDNFWWALLFSILLSFLRSLIEKVERNDAKNRRQSNNP
jgi:putative membrane protein